MGRQIFNPELSHIHVGGILSVSTTKCYNQMGNEPRKQDYAVFDDVIFRKLGSISKQSKIG